MNTQILTIEDFNDIMNGIKTLKCDFASVYQNKIYGTDNTGSIVKMYYLEKAYINEPFNIVCKTINKDFFANITDTSIVLDFTKGKIYCPNNKKYAKTVTQTMIYRDMDNRIINRSEALLTELQFANRISFGDICDDEYFQPVRNIKAADGAIPYYPDGNKEYAMYLYSGALPVNKSDKVMLNIYDTRNGLFTAQFTIYKKKTTSIDVYFKFLKI